MRFGMQRPLASHHPHLPAYFRRLGPPLTHMPPHQPQCCTLVVLAKAESSNASCEASSKRCHARERLACELQGGPSLRSNKQIFWLCPKCPAGQEHSWSAQPFSRTGRLKTSCPFCVGQAACRCNYLQALFPQAAAEWDYSKNQGHPSDYIASSTFLAWWSTPQHASWQQAINSRTQHVQQKRIPERQASVGRSTLVESRPGFDLALEGIPCLLVLTQLLKPAVF